MLDCSSLHRCRRRPQLARTVLHSTVLDLLSGMYHKTRAAWYCTTVLCCAVLYNTAATCRQIHETLPCPSNQAHVVDHFSFSNSLVGCISKRFRQWQVSPALGTTVDEVALCPAPLWPFGL